MVNNAILVGRVGRDPETRFTGSGQAVANLSIATSEKYKDKSGEKQEKTEWHKLVVWGKLAEIFQQYVKKGALIYVEGKIQTREWTDKENIKRYTTEINVREMKMLGSGDRNSTTAGTTAARPQRTSTPPTGYQEQEADSAFHGSKHDEPAGYAGSEISDDDIPF